MKKFARRALFCNTRFSNCNPISVSQLGKVVKEQLAETISSFFFVR